MNYRGQGGEWEEGRGRTGDAKNGGGHVREEDEEEEEEGGDDT